MPSSGDRSLDARVGAILDQLRPYLGTDGVDCKLSRIVDGTVYVQMSGAFKGCSASLMTLRMGIEKRVMEELPDLVRGVEIEP